MSTRTRATGALLAGTALALVACGGDPTAVTPPPTPPTPTATASPSPSPTPSPTPEPTPTPLPTPSPSAAPTEVAAPAWIRIDAARIDQEIAPEGLSADGTINPAGGTVIWYTGHDRVPPGQVGTAVVAGHVVSGGSPDVFHDLPELTVGDQVHLGLADGDVMTFEVVDTEYADKDEVAASRDVWGANDTTRRLAIITCDDALGFRDDGHRVANYVAIAEAA